MEKTGKKIYDFVAKKLEEAKARRFRQRATSRESGELGAKIEAYHEVLNFIGTVRVGEEKKIVGTTTVDKAFEKFLLDTCPEVKKKLRAFEVVKREPMVLSVVQGYETYDDFQDDEEPWLDHSCVSRDEFDLVKETMK